MGHTPYATKRIAVCEGFERSAPVINRTCQLFDQTWRRINKPASPKKMCFQKLARTMLLWSLTIAERSEYCASRAIGCTLETHHSCLRYKHFLPGTWYGKWNLHVVLSTNEYLFTNAIASSTIAPRAYQPCASTSPTHTYYPGRRASTVRSSECCSASSGYIYTLVPWVVVSLLQNFKWAEKRDKSGVELSTTFSPVHLSCMHMHIRQSNWLKHTLHSA